jgi:hypothetical protein
LVVCVEQSQGKVKMSETIYYRLWIYSAFGYWSIKTQTTNIDRLWSITEWEFIGDAPIAITSKSGNGFERTVSKLEYARNTSPDMLIQLKDVINKWIDRTHMLPIGDRKRWQLKSAFGDGTTW